MTIAYTAGPGNPHWGEGGRSPGRARPQAVPSMPAKDQRRSKTRRSMSSGFKIQSEFPMRLSGRRRQTGQDVFDQRTGASIRRGREAGRIVLAEQLNLCGAVLTPSVTVSVPPVPCSLARPARSGVWGQFLITTTYVPRGSVAPVGTRSAQRYGRAEIAMERERSAPVLP